MVGDADGADRGDESVNAEDSVIHREDLNREMKLGESMQISERNLGWLEGIIDGEGYIGIWKAKNSWSRRGFTYQCIITIANTNKAIIDTAHRLIGGGSILVDKRFHNTKWKDAFRLQVGPTVLRGLLPNLKLVAKERQRQILSEALDLISQHRNRHTPHDKRLKELYDEIRTLNKRGK